MCISLFFFNFNSLFVLIMTRPKMKLSASTKSGFQVRIISKTAFSRAWRRRHVFASSLIGSLDCPSVMIGQGDYLLGLFY